MARPSEIKAVAAAISEPADTAEEAAKRAIQALDAARADRTDYLVVVTTGGLRYGYGPYATTNQCQKAIESGRIPAQDGSVFRVVPFRHPSAIDVLWEKVDASPLSEAAAKQWKSARNQRKVPV